MSSRENKKVEGAIPNRESELARGHVGEVTTDIIVLEDDLITLIKVHLLYGFF